MPAQVFDDIEAEDGHSLIKRLVNALERIATTDKDLQRIEANKVPDNWFAYNVLLDATPSTTGLPNFQNICARDEYRHDVTIVNQSGNPVYLSSNKDTSSNQTGWRNVTLPGTGSAITLKTQGPVFAWSPLGTNVDVYITSFAPNRLEIHPSERRAENLSPVPYPASFMAPFK